MLTAAAKNLARAEYDVWESKAYKAPAFEEGRLAFSRQPREWEDWDKRTVTAGGFRWKGFTTHPPCSLIPKLARQCWTFRFKALPGKSNSQTRRMLL